jgi:glutamate carboxypeptidase
MGGVKDPMELLADLKSRSDEMVDVLSALVQAESPTADIEATLRCVDIAAELGERLLGAAPERVTLEGRTHLRWTFGPTTKVLLLGHLDTVWPLGTLTRMPCQVHNDVLTGPGCFDMKGGVAQLLFAVSALESKDGIAIVLTTDEEIGSPTSHALIRETVIGAKAALVLEPSADRALKTSRKGVAAYRITFKGRSAHAGLEPEKGINATLELAHQALEIAALARPEVGTTVTPTVATAGTSSNSVPATATLYVDVRIPTVEESERVKAGLDALHPHEPGAAIEIENIAGSPPFPPSASKELFGRAIRIGMDLGLGSLEGVGVGGGSDGNYTASLGIPTLDGLGAVGDGAHSENEHVIVSAMPERIALVASLVQELLSESPA